MQKVIRRTLLAERQHARRLKRRRDKFMADQASNIRDQNTHRAKEESGLYKEARKARREDWESGPLAPRRDVGDKKETYGSIQGILTRGPERIPSKKAEALKPFGGKFMNIVVGDRVVLLEGQDKGKIGTIVKVDRRRAECTIDGLNMVDLQLLDWMIEEDDPDKRRVRSIEKPLPLASVRLVYPLRNEETGVTKDVIIKKLVNGPIWHDRHVGGFRWARFIAGLNIKIPWPKREKKERAEHECDTLRLDAEVKNFVPTLLRPPMPSTVIDELRNKYSVFRKRHDPEYIERKMAEDREKEEEKRKAKLMMTPTREVNRKARKEKRKLGKGELTPEMLEKIGKVIAAKRQSILDAETISEPIPA